MSDSDRTDETKPQDDDALNKPAADETSGAGYGNNAEDGSTLGQGGNAGDAGMTAGSAANADPR